MLYLNYIYFHPLLIVYPFSSNNNNLSAASSSNNISLLSTTNKNTVSTGKHGHKKVLNINQEYIDNTLKYVKTEKKVKICENCGVDRSPEWRRGPSGHKTLCNACGLRYSRTINRLNQQRAKNDGNLNTSNILSNISKYKRKN